MLKEEEGFGRAWSKRQTSPATARPGVLGGKRLTGDLSRRNRAWSFQKKPEHFKTWGCRAEGYFPKACSLQTSKCARRSSCALKNQQISQCHCSFPTAVTVVAVRKPRCTTSWYLHRCLFKLIVLLVVCFSQTLCLQGSRGDNVSPFCPPARKSSVLKKKSSARYRIFTTLSPPSVMSFVHFQSVFLQEQQLIKISSSHLGDGREDPAKTFFWCLSSRYV